MIKAKAAASRGGTGFFLPKNCRKGSNQGDAAPPGPTSQAPAQRDCSQPSAEDAQHPSPGAVTNVLPAAASMAAHMAPRCLSTPPVQREQEPPIRRSTFPCAANGEVRERRARFSCNLPRSSGYTGSPPGSSGGHSKRCSVDQPWGVRACKSGPLPTVTPNTPCQQPLPFGGPAAAGGPSRHSSDDMVWGPRSVSSRSSPILSGMPHQHQQQQLLLLQGALGGLHSTCADTSCSLDLVAAAGRGSAFSSAAGAPNPTPLAAGNGVLSPRPSWAGAAPAGDCRVQLASPTAGSLLLPAGLAAGAVSPAMSTGSGSSSAQQQWLAATSSSSSPQVQWAAGFAAAAPDQSCRSVHDTQVHHALPLQPAAGVGSRSNGTQQQLQQLLQQWGLPGAGGLQDTLAQLRAKLEEARAAAAAFDAVQAHTLRSMPPDTSTTMRTSADLDATSNGSSGVLMAPSQGLSLQPTLAGTASGDIMFLLQQQQQAGVLPYAAASASLLPVSAAGAAVPVHPALAVAGLSAPVTLQAGPGDGYGGSMDLVRLPGPGLAAAGPDAGGGADPSGDLDTSSLQELAAAAAQQKLAQIHELGEVQQRLFDEVVMLLPLI